MTTTAYRAQAANGSEAADQPSATEADRATAREADIDREAAIKAAEKERFRGS